MKKITTILLTILLIAAFTAPAMADTQGPVTGSFSMSVPPLITGIGVYTDVTLANVATAFTPQQTYYIKVSVTDNDTIADLRTLDLKLYYSEDSSIPTETYFTNNLAGGFEQDRISLRYTYDPTQTLFADQVGFSADAGGYNSWEAATSTQDTADYLSANSHDFVFAVKIGTVARETHTADRWHITALAKGASTLSGYQSYEKDLVYGLPMNWRGAIEIRPPSGNDPVTVDWGTVAPGMAFSHAKAVQAVPAFVVYVCNGDFSGGIKANSSTWTSTGGKTITLKNTLNGQADLFSLKAMRLIDTYNDTTAVTVPENNSTATIFNTGEHTAESGVDFGKEYLFLSLSSNITYPGRYSGTLYYSITNR